MRKIVKAKYPEKTTINLALRDESAENNKISIGVFVIFLAALALFTKFGVIDQIARANEAEAAYREVQSEISALRETNQDYGKIKEEYSHYSNSFLDEEETAAADRMEILGLLDKCVLPMADVQSMEVAENVVTLTINNTTLDTVSAIVASLEGDVRTDFVTVSTAATNTEGGGGDRPVTANIVINLAPAGGETS